MDSIRKEILITTQRLRFFADGANKNHVVWTADLLPTNQAAATAAMIDQSAAVMQRTLDKSASEG